MFRGMLLRHNAEHCIKIMRLVMNTMSIEQVIADIELGEAINSARESFDTETRKKTLPLCTFDQFIYDFDLQFTENNGLLNFATSTLAFFSEKGAALYYQLLDGLLPEFLFTSTITAILTYLALELGKDVDKFTLADSCLRYVRHSLVALVGVYIFISAPEVKQTLFNGYITTAFSIVCVKVLAVLSTLIILFNIENYFKESTRPLLEFPLVLALSLLFLLFLLSSSHLFTAFFAIVGFSLNTYVLIFFEANRSAIARESGIKYFYLSTFSSGLIIYGIFLIFLIFGTGQLEEIQKIIACQPELLLNGSDLLRVALGFLLLGLFFKLSAFPGHL